MRAWWNVVALAVAAMAASVPQGTFAQRASAPVKPRPDDTIRMSIYADNWFALFVNGRLVAVDPIEFLPANVVTIELLPEYPMSIAVLAKDNANPTTGMEYTDQIGDGGFILRTSDGTVTDAKWKAKAFFTAPVGPDNHAERAAIPDGWFQPDFDDRDWPAATIFPASAIRPPASLREADFAGAAFIWSADLLRDNTVIFRTRIERPGWRPTWTTTPDLDLREAPFR